MVPIALTAEGQHVLTHGRATDGQYTLGLWALDADGDQMLDGWEVLFGFDPTNPSDALLDANGDGTSYLVAFQQGTHPTAVPSATRLFAEGATSRLLPESDTSFFDTRVSLFNPGAAPAIVVGCLLGADGEHGSRIVPLAQWAAFVRRTRRPELRALGPVIGHISEFLWPVLQASARDELWPHTWWAGGPWA